MDAFYSSVSSYPLTKLSPYPPQPLVITIWIYTSVRSMFYILHMGNVMLDLSFLALHISVDPSSSAVLLKMTGFHCSNGYITFHCTFVLHSHHLLICPWTLGLILYLCYFSNLVESVRLHPFTLLDMYREIEGVNGSSIFNFWGISKQSSIKNGKIYISTDLLV